MSTLTKTPIAMALGAAFALNGLSVQAAGQNTIFQATDLPSGYTLLAEAEGKCGEGKCGEKKDEEGKCGEGKCGEKKEEGKKEGEGKCGEGKCGAK